MGSIYSWHYGTNFGFLTTHTRTQVVDLAMASLVKVDIPAAWATVDVPAMPPIPPAMQHGSKLQFIQDVARPMLAMEGDNLPVSVFSPAGFTPPGTAEIERRAIASTVPIWKSENCTQVRPMPSCISAFVLFWGGVAWSQHCLL